MAGRIIGRLGAALAAFALGASLPAPALAQDEAPSAIRDPAVAAEMAAAAQALLLNADLDARSVVEKALAIAADICVFTNHNIVIEELPAAGR